ncbi:MAG: ribosome-associated translation inhibitor RaiA [Planctomycetota bacterium]|nr:MAG: ribosome-associated translation inhibitor RaiA [Planctomycetota bacterium]
MNANMNINLAAKSESVTKLMKDYAFNKVGKLEKYFDRLLSVDVVLDAEKERKIAEIIVSAPKGHRFVVKEVQDDMYAAIDQAVDKMEIQLTKFKKKLQSHRTAGRGEIFMEAAGGEEPEEETYQEVVDKTEFPRKEED